MISVKHSGNLGDIIYSIPCVLSLDDQINYYFHLDQPACYYEGARHPLGDVRLNARMLEMSSPLFLYQRYINRIEQYTTQSIDLDLDEFRNLPIHFQMGSTARWYFYLTGTTYDLSQRWLDAPTMSEVIGSIVISRSSRYQNPYINYSFFNKYDNVLFCGVEEEYVDLRKSITGLQYIPVKDFLEMASLINSCRFFVGNQTLGFALAEALKVPRVLEVCGFCPNVIPIGANAYDFYFQQHFEKIVEGLLGNPIV